MKSVFKNYAALDGLRGYAVILVSLTHFVGFYALAYRHLNVETATYFTVANASDGVFLWLYLSMQSLYILLTISGYMVCRMVLRPNYPGVGPFLIARAARIYPPLLFGLAFGVVIYVMFGQPIDLGWRNVAFNVLTLNGIFELKGQPYVFPSWSLFYEIIFCLLLPGMVAFARSTRYAKSILTALWLAFMGSLYLLGFSGWPLFSPFVAGSVLAQFSDANLEEMSKRIPTWGIVTAYCCVAALPSSWAPLPRLDQTGIHFDWRYVAFIVLACLMSAALFVKVVYAAGPLQRLFAWRPLVALGKMSYSFYMLHAPLIFVTFAVVVPAAGHWAQPGTFSNFFPSVLSFWLLSFVAAWVGYYAIEMIYFRSAMSSRSARAQAKANSAGDGPQSLAMNRARSR